MNLDWLFVTPGIGGAVAMLAIASLVTTYYLTLKWIVRGQEDKTDHQ